MLQEVKCPSDSETQGSTLISSKVGFRLQVFGLQTISQKQLIILCCKKLWWVERELNIRHRQNTGRLVIFFKTCRPNTLNCGSDSLGKGDGFKVSCIKSCYLSENCNQNVWRGTSITTRSSSVIPISCGETRQTLSSNRPPCLHPPVSRSHGDGWVSEKSSPAE